MYAQIKNGVVVNVINADQVFADSISHLWDAVVPTTTAGIGWAYSGGVFTPPTATPPTPIRILTKLQVVARFDPAEMAAIYTAAKTNVKVEILLDKFKSRDPVYLDDPDFVTDMNDLETLTLIATGRSAAIRA